MPSIITKITRLGLPLWAAFACFLATGFAHKAQATHLLGGQISYVFLQESPAGFRYRVTFTAYVDGTTGVPGLPNSSFPGGNLGGPGTTPTLAFYREDNNSLVASVALPNQPHPANQFIDSVRIPVPDACTTDDTIQFLRFWRLQFTTEVVLPFTTKGYHVLYGNRARSQLIKNLENPNGTGLSIYAFMAPPLTHNSSPQFVDDATTFICLSDTASLANNARDPDGDRLIYNFTTPLDYNGPMNGTPPPVFSTQPNIDFETGYSLTQPFGGGGVATIDAATGLARYHAARPGAYTVAYEIQEWRVISGVEKMIGVTRREIQIVVRECLPNNPPVGNGGNPNVPPTTSYTIVEGDSISFNVGATDADTMTLSATGDVFDPAIMNGHEASFPTKTGQGQVSSTFTWQTVCGIRGTFPVNIQVEDRGCPPKITNVVYNVNVLPFRAPQTVGGTDSVCGTGQNYFYSVTSTAPDSQFRWRISGGSILSSGTGKNVTVKWDPVQSGIAAGQITIVQTSGAGCRDSTTRIIKVFGVPQVTVAPNQNLCQGDTAQLVASGGSGNYHWTSINMGPAEFLTDSTSASPGAFPMDTTQYIVSSKNVLGCPSRDTISVNVIPDVANAGPDSSICSGGAIQVGVDSVSGYTYSWTPATNLTGAGTARPVFSTTATGNPVDYTLLVTATHANTACTSQDSVTVRVNVLPEVTAGPDTTIVCSRSSVQLGAPNTILNTYEWVPATNLSSAVIPNPTFTLTTGDTLAQVLKYVVTAFNAPTGCKNSDSTFIRVDPLPSIPLAVQDSVCSGADLIIGVPARGYNYTWIPADSLSSSGSSLATFHYTLPAGATIPVDVNYVLRAVNPVTGCVDSSTIRIRVNPLPIVNAGLDKPVCSGDTVSIGTAPNARYAYDWAPPRFLSDTALATQVIRPTYRPNPATGVGDTTINYTLSAVDVVTGCFNTDAVSIRVKELPIVNALPPGVDTATTCSRAVVQLGTADNTDLTYTWTGAPQILKPDSAMTLVYLVNPGLVPHSARYVLSATSATTNCRNADTAFVRVNPQPLVEVGTLDSLCSGQQIQIGAPSRPGYTYSWSPRQGLADSTVSQPTLTLTNGDTLPVTGTYTLLVTNQYSCRDTGSINIRTNPLPAVPLGTAPSVCSKETFTLGLPNRPTLSYQWSPAEGLLGTTTAEVQGMIVNPTQHDSVRTYRLETTSLRTRCQNRDSITVTIRPLPIAQAGPDSVAICSGDTVRLGIDSTAGYSYIWSPAVDLSSSTVSNPLAQISVPVTEVREYRLRVFNTGNGCTNFDSISVRINELPQANAGIDKRVCVDDSVQIGTPGTAGFNYLWSPSQGLTDATQAQTYFHATAADTIDFTLQVTNASTTCKNQDAVTVIINPLPVPNAGIDRQVCSQADVQIGTPAEPGQTYAWLPAGNLSDAAVAQPMYTNVNNTQLQVMDTLTVRATIAATGCNATDEVIVTINPRPIQAQFAPFPATVCPGTQGQPYSVANPQTGYTYDWAVTNTGTLAGGDGTPSVTINYGGPQNNVVISVLATNQYGCVQFRHDSILVTVNQLLLPSTPAPASGLTQLCLNQARDTYSTINSPNSQYTWKYILENNPATTISGAGNQVAVSWPTPGLAKVWVEEIASPPPPFGQCFGSSDTLLVRIWHSPDTTLPIQFNPIVCQYSSPAFVLAGRDSSTYDWKVLNRDGNVYQSMPPTAGPAVFLMNDTGTYTITVLETSNHGCPGKELKGLFRVYPRPATQFELFGYAVCPQRPRQTFSVGNPQPGSQFIWTVGGGSVVAGGNGPSVEIEWSGDAPKTVRVTETSDAGCAGDTIAASLTEDKSDLKMKYVTVGEDDDSRVYMNFELMNGANFPNQLQIWRAENDGVASQVGTVDKARLDYEEQPGNTAENQYSYYVQGSNLCGIDLISETHKTIVLDVTGEEEKGRNGLTHLNWKPYQGFTDGIKHYEVQRQVDGQGGFGPIAPNQFVAATENKADYDNAGDAFDQCYRVVAEANGTGYRSFSNKSCITYKNLTRSFNVVTPDGDGLNDVVYVKNITLYPNAQLRVYNRWGKLVSDRKGYRNDWTPTDLAPGNYTYIVTGTDRTIKGWFEVVK